MKKTAIITGGSKGIGWGITQKLGAEGYNIVLVGSSDRKDNQAALDELRSSGIQSIYLQANIGEIAAHEKLVADALEAFGRIDVLVNNAGVAPIVRADLLEMSPESYDRVMGINLRGPFFFAQRVARAMIKQDEIDGVRGIIVNVSSISSTAASVNRGEYCLSKTGISMMTSLYAARLAEHSILVYEVRPGIIETSMTEKVRDKYDELCSSDKLLIRRWGQPKDVAEAVSVFCSGALRFSPGQVLIVDGGLTLPRL